MGTRRRSRELALQALFYMDMREDHSEEKLTLFLKSRTPSKKALPFFLELVRGIVQTRPEIDAIIERFSSNWKISRMSGVDRNALRIAVFEMLCREDIPEKVSINEAIDLGKKFGSEDSGAFINGILDSIRNAVKMENLQITPPVPGLALSTESGGAADLPMTVPSPEKPAISLIRGKTGVVKRKIVPQQ